MSDIGTVISLACLKTVITILDQVAIHPEMTEANRAAFAFSAKVLRELEAIGIEKIEREAEAPR